MPNDFVDTFNSIIPSHLMKFILWQDVDDSADEVAREDDPYSEEDEDVDEVADVQPVAELNQVLQVLNPPLVQ